MSVKLLWRFKLISILFICVFLQTNSYATDTYKCIKDGKIGFSQTPCPDGKSELIDMKTIPVSKADYQKATKQAAKDKKELAKIIKEKDKENTQYRKASAAAYKKNKTSQKRCEDAQQKAVWAKEDLKNTQPKTEMKAQAKLKRAQERADLACKS